MSVFAFLPVSLYADSCMSGIEGLLGSLLRGRQTGSQRCVGPDVWGLASSPVWCGHASHVSTSALWTCSEVDVSPWGCVFLGQCGGRLPSFLSGFSMSPSVLESQFAHSVCVVLSTCWILILPSPTQRSAAWRLTGKSDLFEKVLQLFRTLLVLLKIFF